MLRVITNNPSAMEWWKDSENNNVHITWQDGDLSDVLSAARDLIHRGWSLVNHPLASSIKPNQTPYKTIVLQPGEGLDYQSLSIIESSLATVQKFGPFTGGTERVHADLQLIDLELCKDI